MTTFTPADILLPADGLEYMKWAVVACDQYTSDENYWKKTKRLVGDAPSTLSMTLPEIYLSKKGKEKRIAEVNAKMKENLETGKFKTIVNCFIYLERTLSDGTVRKGLIGKLDLEDYSFEKGAKTLVRATEGTVLERIPPRVEIRKNAPIEFPHVMILIDDPERTVIEPLSQKRSDFAPLYDFDLMNRSGHVKGWIVRTDAAQNAMKALDKLGSKTVFNKKYGFKSRKPLLFAVGDGNHSLATAKTCWNEIKKTLTPEEAAVHPARYALVEVVNLHDDSLKFEPIHRVVFGADAAKMTVALAGFFKDISIAPKPPKDIAGRQVFVMLSNGNKQYVSVTDEKSNLTVGSLQAFLDEYLKKETGIVDYIHGDEEVERLCKNPENIGFLLPTPAKDELFETVVLDGALPRKTFSMGHAQDKRFYLEGRKIR